MNSGLQHCIHLIQQYIHVFPTVILLIAGVFHIANALLKQLSDFAVRLLKSIGLVAKNFREMRREVRGTEKETFKRSAGGKRPVHARRVSKVVLLKGKTLWQEESPITV